MDIATTCRQVEKHPELHQLLQQIADGALLGYLLFPGSGLYTPLITPTLQLV